MTLYPPSVFHPLPYPSQNHRKERKEKKMGSSSNFEKRHAVCVPYPAQGHITPMLKLSKVLHQRSFHITFVNTEYNHSRLLKSWGPHSLDGLSTFRFETIPDGLPLTDAEATQDIPSLCYSTPRNCLVPFKQMLHRLNHESESSDIPPVSCIVSDGLMSFTVDAAEELGTPEVLFWTASACGFLAYTHYAELVEKGLVPFKDEGDLTNGHMDTIIDWIPSMEGIRLKDIPSFIRTTDINDIMLNFFLVETERAKRAKAIILNTFDSLEHESLKVLKSVLPPVFSIGPLHLLVEYQIPKTEKINEMNSSLWKEDTKCLEWLDTQNPNSVVYVNFGSITVMTKDQMVEFAWGLANSENSFLWVIRPDLVTGESAMLSEEFLDTTKNRGMLTTWCPQEKVLCHPSVGGFLTHSGWNSTLESVCAGVPMICWPFFAEQQTNCRYSCVNWKIGMEIDNNVKRGEVENLVKELMDGERGKGMRKQAMEFKRMAKEAVSSPHGSSVVNLENLINNFLKN